MIWSPLLSSVFTNVSKVSPSVRFCLTKMFLPPLPVREPQVLACLPTLSLPSSTGQGAGKPKSFAVLMATEAPATQASRKQTTPLKKSGCSVWKISYETMFCELHTSLMKLQIFLRLIKLNVAVYTFTRLKCYEIYCILALVPSVVNVALCDIPPHLLLVCHGHKFEV